MNKQRTTRQTTLRAILYFVLFVLIGNLNGKNKNINKMYSNDREMDLKISDERENEQ